MLCTALCGHSAAASRNKPSQQHVILFFCSALPLSEGLCSHRRWEKSCFYSLPDNQVAAYHRHQTVFSAFPVF